MDAEKKKEFTARISQANKSQLTVVVFDIILEEISCALEVGGLKENKNLESYENSLKKARDFVGELIDSLDMRYAIARELRPIYLFVNKEIIYALLTKNARKLPRIHDIMSKLRDSFEAVSHQDFSEPLMENTQRIYAGLTYGRGKLNEISVDVNQASRGFKV